MTKRPLLPLFSCVLLLSVAPQAIEAQQGPGRASLVALPPMAPVDGKKAALGRDLFHDARLSRSMRLSCASCHDLNTNGASANRVDRDDRGVPMRYNTLTVFNARYSPRLGWEGRAHGLRDLVLDTLGAGHAMNGGAVAAGRVANDPRMAARFRAAYGRNPDAAIIADALAVFIETLVAEAPFDRWLRGDGSALTPQQIRGLGRFQALGCASCHQGRNVGANLFQRRGIFRPLGAARPTTLRVPSLRNVAVTAPYFHDGSAAQLPDAIRAMAKAQLNLTISERDVADISAFLQSLTGTYQGKALRAPVKRP